MALVSRLFFFVFFICSSFSFASANVNQEAILGSWLFYKYKYQDHESPAPNPKLQQIISFDETGSARLYYKRDDEDWFCERVSAFTYSSASKKLFQQVVWVNPNNHSSCSMDPDMQMGRKTENTAYTENDEFFLEMPLNDQTITFVWKKLTPVSAP